MGNGWSSKFSLRRSVQTATTARLPPKFIFERRPFQQSHFEATELPCFWQRASITYLASKRRFISAFAKASCTSPSMGWLVAAGSWCRKSCCALRNSAGMSPVEIEKAIRREHGPWPQLWVEVDEIVEGAAGRAAIERIVDPPDLSYLCMCSRCGRPPSHRLTRTCPKSRASLSAIGRSAAGPSASGRAGVRRGPARIAAPRRRCDPPCRRWPVW